MTSPANISWARAIPYGTSEEASIVLDRASHHDFERWALNTSREVVDWPPDASMSCVELEGHRTADDVIPNHLGLFVVSERLTHLIASLGAEGLAQFLPVPVDYQQKTIGQYYALNLLQAVPALDLEASRVTRYTSLDVWPAPVGAIKYIGRAVLHAQRLPHAPPIFRLAEDLSWVIVSPVLRERVSQLSITGFHFTDLET